MTSRSFSQGIWSLRTVSFVHSFHFAGLCLSMNFLFFFFFPFGCWFWKWFNLQVFDFYMFLGSHLKKFLHKIKWRHLCSAKYGKVLLKRFFWLPTCDEVYFPIDLSCTHSGRCFLAVPGTWTCFGWFVAKKVTTDCCKMVPSLSKWKLI